MGGPTRSLTSKPGAGGDDPLLNGPTEGWVRSSATPRCRTSLLHLLQPLHVQRGVYTCWSHGCWLPALPGSRFHVLSCFTSHLPGGQAVWSCAGHWCVRRPYWNLSFLSKQSAVHTIASNQSLLASPINKVGVITQEVHHHYFRRSYSTKGLYGKETKEKYIFEKKRETNYFSAS